MSLYEKAAMIARQFAYVLMIVNTVEKGTIVIDEKDASVNLNKADVPRG